jgi:dsDNA-binding SOS-regulon protein
MTLYKDLQGKIQRLYYAYIKNGYEVDFVTSKIADERFRYFPKIGKIVKFLENIKIDDEEKEFLNIFLNYPFLHCDDFVRYTYIVRQDTDEVNEQFALFNVDEKEDLTRALAAAEKDAMEYAKTTGILELANQQSETLVKGILANAIPSGYTIEFRK